MIGTEEEKKEILFPQLFDCHHFHYRTLFLKSIGIQIEFNSELKSEFTQEVNKEVNKEVNELFRCRVRASDGLQTHEWTIRRSLADFRRLDCLLHTCLFSRDISRLDTNIRNICLYVSRLNELFLKETSCLHCSSLLSWLESDNSGHHLCSPDSEVNRRAVGAAFVIKEYSRDCDHVTLRNGVLLLDLEIGDLISIIEFNSTIDNRKQWSKGKKGIQVGFFPSECVQLIDENVIQNEWKEKKKNEKEFQKPSKIASFFQRLLSHETTVTPTEPRRPQPLPNRVFGRDLCEHLFNSCDSVPQVVTLFTRFIEMNGLLDGIYRLSGIASNIHRLRQELDARQIPDLASDPIIAADVHCVSSLLKLYFRELPNPLLTFQLYDCFVETIRRQKTTSTTDTRRQIRHLVRRLPPPHRRTLCALIKHLNRVSKASHLTGMTAKNLAIVWAPNLLRSRDIDQRSLGGDLAALQVIGIQAVLTEYLIENCEIIFSDNESSRDADCRLDDAKDDTKDDVICRLNTRNQFNKNLKLFSEKYPKRRRTDKRRETTDILVQNPRQTSRVKSFESYFGGKPDLALNFAKKREMFSFSHVLKEFDEKYSKIWTQFTREAPQKCQTIVTSLEASIEAIVVRDIGLHVQNDSVKVEQAHVTTSMTSRERIERIKAERRQQLRQQFDTRPVPTPRKSVIPSNLRHIGPKVDARRQTTSTTTPVPTPRRRNSCEITAITITPLRTTSRARRNNWNRNATQMFESKN